MKFILTLILLTLFTGGCESLPIRDGELAIGANTTAGVEDMGVAKIANKF